MTKRLLIAVFLALCFALSSESQTSTATLYYVVTATDGTLESGFSNQASAVVSPAHNVVDLTWTASTTSGVTGYFVYRGKVSGGPYTRISNAVAGTSYTDTLTFPQAPTSVNATVP